MHAECGDAAGAECPKCRGWIPVDEYFAPATPLLDIVVGVLGAAVVVLSLLCVVVLSFIPWGSDAPANSGILLLFLLPLAAVDVVLVFVGAITWTSREKARKPVRVER